MPDLYGKVTELSSVIPPLRWIPNIGGPQTKSFIVKQEEGGKTLAQMNQIVIESTRILGRCVDPKGASETATGLVVGKVQSGKTMSFTALTALAHDNGYGLVVIIAGTKNNLIDQTVSRIQNDLGIHEDRVGKWVVFKNPSNPDGSGAKLKSIIDGWLDPHNDRKRVPLVVVLKHSGRMKRLSEILVKANIKNLPTLIIDDESDQAGLNTYARSNRLSGSNKMSSNYASIIELRKQIPFHTYVQYTATPQANLLLDIHDELAPDFAEVLSTGDGYVGGRDFFFNGSPFIRTIPDQDIIISQQISNQIPNSLLEAFSVFVYGCAFFEYSGNADIRTMMIHPSQETEPHTRYLRWTKSLLDEWRRSLSEIERSQYIYDFLERGRKILQSSFDTQLPSPEKLPIYHVIRNTELREVNATPRGNTKIKWGDSPYWLIVGGAKLDRGFTVEGLVVTYMPRPLGDGNADTVQQRARFFGYKKNYLNYCRIYLESSVRNAFENYVEHEEVIHKKLVEHRGQPLGLWPRKFILDSALKPTRENVVGIDMKSILLENWVLPNHLAKNLNIISSNRDTIFSFISSLPVEQRFVAAEAYPENFIDKRSGPDSHKHWLYQDVSARKFLDNFIHKFETSHSDDTKIFLAIELFIERLVEINPNESIDLFVMRDFSTTKRSYLNNRINPFQGPSPNTKDRNLLTYSGDKSFHFEDRISVQIHFLDIFESSDKNAQELARNCPWICFYIPEGLRRRILIDEEV